MKTTYTFLAALILFALPPVVLAQKSVFTFPFVNLYRLPSMETRIHVEEITNSYQKVGNIYTTEITGFDDTRMEQTSTSYLSDAKVMDAIRFLEIYMDENLVTPGDESSGILEMSIIYFNERSRINPGSILGVLTLGLGTLLGIPYATSVTDVEVEASIFRESDSQAIIHRGVGRGKELQSLYHMSTRKAHQKALRNALEDLNERIMADPDLVRIPR